MAEQKVINEDILKNAQFRKGLSISYFNSINSAIALVAAMPIGSKVDILAQVLEYRDFFLEEHKNYYATVIASVGTPYDVPGAIEQMEYTKTIDELKQVWLGLSEGQRRDGEVLKAKNKIKKHHEKI